MNINRRCFLAMGAGLAAGTALSPLPYKLMDDVAIWTQNWPWTPVPNSGGANYINSVCSLCRGGCGISVKKIENRAVKIEGMNGHPINDGSLCILGLSGLQLLYDSTLRIKSPLKITGKRGEGKFEAISWEQAISEVAKYLSDLKEKGQSKTLGCILDSKQGTVPDLFMRFLNYYGSQNFIKPYTSADTLDKAVSIMYGIEASTTFDLENADFILSFGTGLLDGWQSPVRMCKINSNWNKNNVKLIQIESRLSNTASKAYKWIPIIPGTEVVLMMGIANIILKEALYKSDFIKSNIINELNKILNEYNVQYVSKITGVNESEIISLSRDFSKSSRSIAICSKGQGNNSFSIKEALSCHILNLLVGNINKKGGVGIIKKHGNINFSNVEIDRKNIDGLNALFIYNSNPLYTFSDTESVKKKFEKINFIVNFTSFFDESANYSDLILPNHIYLERYEDLLNIGFNKILIELSKPVVSPQFNTRYTGDIIIQIAKKMGNNIANGFKWDNYEVYLKESLGNNWEELNKTGFNIKEYLNIEIEKLKITNNGLKLLSSDILINPEGDNKSFPLVLIPYDSMRISNGYIGSPPFLIKTVEDTILKDNDIFIEINPITAKDNELLEGDYANLTTSKGQAKVKIHIFNGIMPGVIAMPRGLGHNAYNKFLAGKGINFNSLIGAVEESSSGLDAFWGIRAKLAKA